MPRAVPELPRSVRWPTQHGSPGDLTQVRGCRARSCQEVAPVALPGKRGESRGAAGRQRLHGGRPCPHWPAGVQAAGSTHLSVQTQPCARALHPAGRRREPAQKGRPKVGHVPPSGGLIHVTQCRQGDVYRDRSRACDKRRHGLLPSHARLREWLTQDWLVTIRRLLCPGHPVMSQGRGHGVNAGDLHADPFLRAGALTSVTTRFRACWSARWPPGATGASLLGSLTG